MKLIILCLGVALLGSCAISRVAVVSSEQIPKNKDQFVFENDTVQIAYSFWAYRGLMSFTVYNKLDKPIFVDWKNSSFISNDQILSYWKDEVNTKTEFRSAYAPGYYYQTVNHGVSKSQSVKENRVILIPPHSYIANEQYHLINYFDDLPKITRTYTPQNTPVRFRNFLSISTNEKFEGEIGYINNIFFVSEVMLVKFQKTKQAYSQTRFYIGPKKIK